MTASVLNFYSLNAQIIDALSEQTPTLHWLESEWHYQEVSVSTVCIDILNV